MPCWAHLSLILSSIVQLQIHFEQNPHLPLFRPEPGELAGLGGRALDTWDEGLRCAGLCPSHLSGTLGVLALFQPSGSCPSQHDGRQCSGSHFRAPMGEEQPFSSAPSQTYPRRTLWARPHTVFSCDTRHTLVRSPAQWTASSLGLGSLTCPSQPLA